MTAFADRGLGRNSKTFRRFALSDDDAIVFDAAFSDAVSQPGLIVSHVGLKVFVAAAFNLLGRTPNRFPWAGLVAVFSSGEHGQVVEQLGFLAVGIRWLRTRSAVVG